MENWNNKAKRLLKSELIKRGITNSDLAQLLNRKGIEETKASIDSKISRGSFSASFFLQCLSVIGCNKITIEDYETNYLLVAEPETIYEKTTNEK
ncbi:DUF6471 domain-containing protein [Flavobacterium sp. KACC 22758]|uniref:DUF6471 domain-containing protein n=1 Tax=Flavobacterium sp. KACC 22758 TaxID=3025667 RepID=UPI002365B3FE|nr:DUF6471 domain-containing protein [Flavobacterium sp. KACC 22758]WDF59893.1 DUF6471 domain-containing protein [Flavobacterium sp. KACC 22758]